MNDITRSIAALAGSAGNIAENGSRAAGGMDGMARNLGTARTMAKESRQGAGEVSRSAAELADLASQLKTLLGQFSV